MKFVLMPLATITLILVPTLRARGAGADLRGAVEVSGREVVIQLRHSDGRPAAAIQVRLIDARKLAVAAGRTDGAGHWAHTIERTGTYEGIVEGGPGGEETLRLPFTVLDTPASRHIPWGTAVAGLACGVGAFVLFLFRLGSSRRGLVPLRAALLTAGVGLLGWSAGRYWLEPCAPAASADPDIAGAARAFLRDRKVKPLSEPLARLLADPTKRVETQPHPLLGQPAPDFELTGAREQASRLSERLRRGPVVLVFYYGYYCNHCVGQLFALHDDIAKFRELGAEVVAVSADPPELTRERFRQYGDFAFPVLSDPNNKVAQVYGVYRPASGEKSEDQQHGTFVIGRDGRVHWAHRGYEPFTRNRTLLYELARLEGRLPPGKRE